MGSFVNPIVTMPWATGCKNVRTGQGGTPFEVTRSYYDAVNPRGSARERSRVPTTYQYGRGRETALGKFNIFFFFFFFRSTGDRTRKRRSRAG